LLPSRIRESRDKRERLNHIGGLERLKLIAALPVVNVETGETANLGDLEGIYSREWIEAMTGKSGAAFPGA
jgi:hypothetical protein